MKAIYHSKNEKTSEKRFPSMQQNGQDKLLSGLRWALSLDETDLQSLQWPVSMLTHSDFSHFKI